MKNALLPTYNEKGYDTTDENANRKKTHGEPDTNELKLHSLMTKFVSQRDQQDETRIDGSPPERQT